MKLQIKELETKNEWKKPEIIELDINLDTTGNKDKWTSSDGTLFSDS